MINFLSSLYILEIRPLSDVGLVKIFSHSVGCHFALLTVSFALPELFSFRRSHSLIVALSVCATGVIFRKWSPVLVHSNVLPTFSSMKFSVAGFMLRSLIHLDLSLCMVRDIYPFSFFYMLISSYASTIYWICFLFSILYFFTSLSKLRCL